jgi:hypothetical protein
MNAGKRFRVFTIFGEMRAMKLTVVAMQKKHKRDRGRSRGMGRQRRSTGSKTEGAIAAARVGRITLNLNETIHTAHNGNRDGRRSPEWAQR